MKGQPYKKQWWMRYFAYPNRFSWERIQFKKNRFTGTVYVFVMLPNGNRWNEPGYGWGQWVRL